MARITEATGSTIDLTQFEDDEPYKVRIQAVGAVTDTEYQGKKGRQLEITWSLVDDPETTLKDWLSLSLGKQKNGTVSKFRQFLNALAQKPKDESIKWFDDEELTWSYNGTHAHMKLEAGLEAILSGEIRDRADPTQGKKFAITKYKAPKVRKARPADYEDEQPEDPRVAAQRAMAKVRDNDSESIPF